MYFEKSIFVLKNKMKLSQMTQRKNKRQEAKDYAFRKRKKDNTIGERSEELS